MIEISYIQPNGKKTLCIYFSSQLSLEDIKKRYIQYDEIQLYDPKELDNSLTEIGQEFISFIHANQNWTKNSYTGVIRLDCEVEDIFGKFHKTLRYDIRRAMSKDNLHVKFSEEPTYKELCNFFDFYDRFADAKKIGHIDRKRILAFVEKNCLTFTYVYDESGTLLCVHSYMKDNDLYRVRLNTSSSMLRTCDDKQKIGRANGYLHFADMTYFKEKGYIEYDIGGIPLDVDMPEDYKKNATYKMKFGCNIEKNCASPVIDLTCLKQARIKTYIPIGIKNIIIFGAGKLGKKLYTYIRNEINVLAYMDNDETCVGGYLMESLLCTPVEFMSFYMI